MSQVKFFATANIPNRGEVQVEVFAGWDRPDQEYFMSVFNVEDGDDIIWTSLEHPDNTDSLGTERLERQLARLNIEPPASFWETLKASGAKNEGNVIYTYSGDQFVRHQLDKN